MQMQLDTKIDRQPRVTDAGLLTTADPPAVGQIWVVKPSGGSPPFFSWKRFVRIDSIDAEHNRIIIRTVKKRGDEWIIVGRKSKARLSKFDGTYWNYVFVEHGCDLVATVSGDSRTATE